MGENSSIGFGGFLLGLGGGWLLFSNYVLNVSSFGYLLVIIGAAIILSGLVRMLSGGSSFGSLFGGAVGGLVLALILTQGFGFIGNMGNVSWGGYQSTATANRNFSGTITGTSTLFKTDNTNGEITVKTWDRKDYDVKVEVKARGGSQSEAEQRLKEITIDVKKTMDKGAEVLELTYNHPTYVPAAYTLNIVVTLPADALNDLDLHGMNGEITVSDLKANSVRAVTTNGQINLNRVKSVNIKTSTLNGAIVGEVAAEAFDAQTTNGKIDLTVTGETSGKYSLSNVNGAIKVTNTRPAGYNIDARVTNGDITLGLPNLQYSTNTRTHKVATTSNLDKYPLKMVIDVSTVNGSINLSTSASATF
jgi:DUF4097 and DUF4098 domain-containing protein YvlB